MYLLMDVYKSLILYFFSLSFFSVFSENVNINAHFNFNFLFGYPSTLIKNKKCFLLTVTSRKKNVELCMLNTNQKRNLIFFYTFAHHQTLHKLK